MDLSDLARAIFALALTLGIIGLAAVALRRFGPDAIARIARPKRERRLAVVENLVLDPTRRIVLVSCDGQEMLLLLGEGRVLAEGVAPAPQDAA